MLSNPLRQRSRTAEDGFSLIELLVVLVLLGIVGGVIMTATVNSLQTARKSQDRVIALNELTTSLERIGRDVRSAFELDPTVLTDVNDANKVIAANVARAGTVFKHRFYLDESVTPTVLRSDLYEVTGAGDVLVHQAELVIDTANTATGEELVKYYAEDGSELRCTAADTVPVCSARLSTAQFIEIRLVRALPEQQPVLVQTLVNIRSSRF